MAYIVVAYIVIAYIVMVYVVMALWSLPCIWDRVDGSDASKVLVHL